MIPASTYRLQVSREQTLDVIRGRVPYLHRLGVSTLYLSPLFQARAGSTHGYDTVDPTRISEDLGGEEALDRLVRTLREHDMGLLLDIVPNHLAATPENPWWRNVLEHGRASPFAHYFDIEWSRPAGPAKGKIVLPILGDRYGEVLDRGELSVGFDQDGFTLRYFDHTLPIDPRNYGDILMGGADGWEGNGSGIRGGDGGAGHFLDPSPIGAGSERGSTGLLAPVTRFIEEFRHLPHRDDSDAEACHHRVRRAGELKDELWQASLEDEEVRAAIDRALDALSPHTDPSQDAEDIPEGNDRAERLDRVLSDQPWWLVFWRTEGEVTNYRRFFNISDLVGVRVEEPEVFDATHGVIHRLVTSGAVTGLRVDHIDGLHDPEAYLERLSGLRAGPNGDAPAGALHIVVEKILAEGEELPPSWPVSGSTGYDFLAAVNGLFVEPVGFASIDRDYRERTGLDESFEELLYRKKRAVILALFPGDLAALAKMCGRLVRSHPHGRDFTTREVHEGLLEITASLPVYRTYIREGRSRAEDRTMLEETLIGARSRVRHLPDLLFAVLGEILMGEGEAAHRAEGLPLVRRWQQFTGATMAKGLEDTTFYIYNALLSLNEVGGEPGSGATPATDFHDYNRRRLERWPGALNTTSTHDTKRSEDVRTRISVLSEIPAAWAEKLTRWRAWNAPKRIAIGGREVPSVNEEIMLYQNLLGAWPLDPADVEGFRPRMTEFLTKALREAKVRSSWRSPHETYEKALADFTDRILKPDAGNAFLPDFLAFQKEVAFYGALNSLSQVILKTISPGVPDFYQGTELWMLALVDPDNRRPVDFDRRIDLLDSLEDSDADSLPEQWADGRIKLLVTSRALHLRRDRKELFLRGAYLPLATRGDRKDHVLAVAREREGQWAIGVAPRWFTRFASPGSFPTGKAAWGDGAIRLPKEAPERWIDVLTGAEVTAEGASGRRELPLSSLLSRLPVALLRSLE